jgi:MtrB/PioB family decaheme-associated outer membrane protein
MKTQKLFRLSAIGAALAVVFGPTLAQEVAELIEPDSAISVGVGNWSSDRRQTGMYDGMQDGKTYLLIDADINKRDNATGTWYRFETRNLGLDTRSAKGEILRQGNWGIGLEYNRLQRNDPNIYGTNVTGIGSPQMTATGAVSLYNAELGVKRERWKLNGYKNLMPGLDFHLSYMTEEKTGTRNWSMSGNSFAPEPIDSTTRQLEAALSWTTEKYQLRGGYNGSWYGNDVTGKMASLSTPTGTTTFPLPPDNQAHQLFLNGGYNFTKDTRGSFKLEYARATQNDSFAAIPGATIPVGSPGHLDGEVVTKLLQLGLNSRITKDFSLNANLRYHDKDDNTPTNIIFHTPSPGPTTHSHPHFDQSVRTLSGKVEGAYRFANVYTLVGSIEEKRQKRDMDQTRLGTGEIRMALPGNLDETTTRLELRRSLTNTVNGSLSWVHAKRDGSDFGGPQMAPTAVMQQLNPFNVADRKRDKIRAVVEWMPIEPVSVQFVVEDGRDKYSGLNPLGLEKGNTRLYSLDASWTVSDKLSFNAWYSYDQNKAKQTMRHGNTMAETRRWDMKDSADSLGLGIKWEATPKLHTGFNLEWTKSLGQYDVAAWADATGLPVAITPAGGGDLPSDITDKHLRVSLFAMYAISKSSDIRFDVIYDKWKTNDWTWTYSDGLPMYLSNGGATTVFTRPNESATFVGVRYIYKFQ